MFTLIWAAANVIINPIALYYWFYGTNQDLFWPILGWILLSSLAEEMARTVVFGALGFLINLGLSGVGALGIIGFIIVAILFSAVVSIELGIILGALWIYALVLLIGTFAAMKS